MSKKQDLLKVRADLVKERLKAFQRGDHNKTMEIRKTIKIIDKAIKDAS